MNGNVDVFDFNSLNYYQLKYIVNSHDITICVWCFSECNPVIRMILKS